jgi:hypothetical protein
MRITFLGADVPLCKSYGLDSQGRLTKSSYPAVWQFTSHEEEVPDFKAFTKAVKRHAAAGHCLLKGNVSRPLVRESRAGATSPNEATSWLLLDLDQTAPGATVESCVSMLVGDRVDYMLQHSGSYGIEPGRGTTIHLAVPLLEGALPSALKQWLMWKNLTTPELSMLIRLTKTNTALSWPLDITTCQNDKLIYIAPPVLGPGVVAPDIERIVFVERRHRHFQPDFSSMPPAGKIRAMMEERINMLRVANNLPARKFNTVIDKATGLEVLQKCDAATMTALKRERGFVYFNLNGGDSWGYYHPEDRPEVIRNFKGEPDYKTSELLPEYWASIQSEKKQVDYAKAEERNEIQGRKSAVDTRLLVFRDFSTGLYYNGTYDGSELALAQAKSETQIQHFLMEHGKPPLDFIPTWDLVFDPQDDVRVDFDRKRVNLWTQSKYMLAPAAGKWPTIRRLIEHAVGPGPIFDHYVNWLAVIYQYRQRTQTAWTLHGIEGTGKGLLVNKVLRPLFGEQVVVVKRMDELDDNFNAYLEGALMVIVDEAQVSESRKAPLVMANLKNQITEPTITVRAMRTVARAVKNYTNWMFCSNMPDPVMISSSDRRMNVGVFQDQRLEITDEEFEALEAELYAFAHYLSKHKADRTLARTVLATADRDRIIETSKTSVEHVADALKIGMLESFWDSLPSGGSDMLSVSRQLLQAEYINLVHASINGKSVFTRDELRVVFEYLCGDMPHTPAKFVQFLKHRGLYLTKVQVGPDRPVVLGLEVTWQVDETWLEARRRELKPKVVAISGKAA